MDNKTEVVVFHDMAEVIVDGSKVLVWVGTQTYTIRHLDEAEENEYNLKNSTEITDNQEVEPIQIAEQPQQRNSSVEEESSAINSEPRDQVVLVIQDDGLVETQPSPLSSAPNSLSESINFNTDVISTSANKVNNDHNIEKVNLVDDDDDDDDDQVSVSDTVQSLSSSSNDGTELSSVSDSGKKSITLFNAMKLVSNLDQSKTICPVCFKTFSTEYSKKRHQLSHFGIKPYRCNFCMKFFAQSSSYYSHKCTANIGGFDLPPPVSQISMGRKPSLNTTSSPSSSYRKMLLCNACGKSFPGIYKLKRHEISHTGEKPYRCAICLRAFTQWTGMSRHNCPGKSVDTDKIPPACEDCGKIFKNNKYLQIHRQIHKFDGRSDVDDKDIDQAFNSTDLEIDSAMEFLKEMFC